MDDTIDDCIIVGGGPAGLTAAIYLARYHLSIRLFDCGTSRAALIPCTHNHAGYPEGIAGLELVGRMLEQAEKYGVVHEEKRVEHLAKTGDCFVVGTDEGTFRARTVLLATGVFNRHPPGMDDAFHDEALFKGLLRYCPVCDGYEVTDKRVGIIGTGSHGTAEAIFLRSFTKDVTLISPTDDHDLEPECLAKLDEAGIVRVDGPCGDYAMRGDKLAVDTAEGWLEFDSVYPALGSDVRSQLAQDAGADCTDVGCIKVDDHQRTSVPGLFAAGDVVIGLDQISHAMGQAGVAATTIRNDLADERSLLR
ncbi:NAD(P)-binding protein [Erythrobacter arachoides]|uniref:Thioredoxin reductase n=1 Tax=Aurantiacibacter arachoides TaxID=1850444 RepID=A0A845A2S7_9SPHN|nr:NAD(P)/FAD-dependent oxidoreductase [Aurantiacibacter arachoides]MXO93456.1 NAD(P)-binding protein [Aurantiacibacter arachoides]GGD49249.1 pyridine nucleotide-disulfide oxidoreductase [Aurantiacibacter arachoides]